MVTAVDYTPFGMIMQGMNYGSAAPGKYRYGFNGKEWENSTKGNADQIDYGERMYDNRSGRFLSVDPLTAQYPWYSPYQFAGNTPIQAIDLDGQEEYHYIMSLDKQGKTVLKLNSTKYYNEHNWFGYKFKTKIDHERYIVDFAGSKYYIGFASNVGRNNNWKRAEFKQFLKNPDALAFIYTFDDAQTEARNAFISDMQIAGVAALGVYDNMRLGLIRQRTAINPQGLKRLNEYNFKRAYKPTTFEGEEIPASKNGLSPDFKNTSFLYKAEGNQSSIVKIKLTGKYFGEGGDFEAANLAGGFKNTPKGYTWHHLDDFDPATGTSTMQLVRKDAHGETITHTGSVRQYELYNNAEYKVK
jgi:RHS repeat-associated protein